MFGTVQVGKAAPALKGVACVDGRLKGIVKKAHTMEQQTDALYAEFSLSSYAEAKHWVVLVFFPKAWSFICPTEIKAFSARLEELVYARSCAVAFISTDSEFCLKAWNATSEMEGGLGGVHVPLVSDSNHKICRDYGVLIEEEGVAQRALFIIDPSGRIRNITVNDADIGRSVDETIRILDALAFKDEFGEGCPVDWKKGDKGLDYSAKSTVEGPVDIPKRSWAGAAPTVRSVSEWARPKIQRAWSGASQASIGSLSHLAVSSEPRERVHSTITSGNHSPLVSPGMKVEGEHTFQDQLDEAMSAQKNIQAAMENMQAAMHNQTIGVAN